MRLAVTFSVLAYTEILETPAAAVASGFTDRENSFPTVPTSVPAETAVFVVPSCTIHFPALFVFKIVLEPSGVVISA